MKLERFEHQGLELVIDTETGACFTNQNALARMCGVESTQIRRWKEVSEISTFSGEILTSKGLQGVTLFNEDAIFAAFEKYKPELLKVCAKAGLRLYLHQLAGYRFVAVQSDSAMLAQILTVVQEMQSSLVETNLQLAETKQELAAVRLEFVPVKEELTAIKVVLKEFQGLEKILDDLKGEIAKPNQKSFTLNEILSFLGFGSLSKGERSKVGRQLNAWLSTNLMHKLPKKNNYTLYQECFVPLVQFAVETIL